MLEPSNFCCPPAKPGVYPREIMLGSVADRVLKRAHCPTLVFNPYKGEQGYQVTLKDEPTR